MRGVIDKKFILEKIKEIAQENDGAAPGMSSFEKITGIPVSKWRGKYWVTWNEAISEAGLNPNSLNEAYSDEFLLKSLAELTIKLGRIPTYAHFRMEKKNNPLYPSYNAIIRLGEADERVEKLRSFAEQNTSFTEVLSLLPNNSENPTPIKTNKSFPTDEGFVYLGVLKVGSQKRYKIGKTNLVSRRSSELSLQLPEKIELVHYIKTDDMTGIEKYWHNRFADKNTNGEWFNLSAEDVKAFKLRKFM